MANCFYDILTATASMTDCTLEPDDDTKYIVTIRNRSECVTAKNVIATIGLVGGHVPGIEVVPDDRWFGDIPPGGKAQREIVILTKRAPACSKQKICYHVHFEASYQQCEGEVTEFEIGCD
ncbi:hypothetical protein V202x_53230 [Gimesia aquarii]|uniref:Uncharacterized protein n=2 Tax=Gimesia aquarii TaxID=2527964 RepID=A0A517X323_9PLAN|nr:hypothetical protein V202x_53230 [Gimesia aquarii]